MVGMVMRTLPHPNVTQSSVCNVVTLKSRSLM